MCFSAAASFGAGVVLSVIGFFSMKKAKFPSEMMFAGIPFLFAVQQTAEGILWLTLANGKAVLLQNSMTYLYLVIAQIIWPIWIPAAVLLLEKEQILKRIQKILAVTGSFVSLYMIYYLFNYKINASIDHYHIRYIENYPQMFSVIGSALYVIATVGPTFLSSTKHMRVLGTCLMLSYIISILFYEDYLVSVWCFFASIISISVYLIMHELQKSHLKEIHQRKIKKRHPKHARADIS